MSDNFKTFEFEDKEYLVIKPNNKIRRESDRVYAQAYRQALADDFLLEAEIEDLLDARGFDNKTLNKKKNRLVSDIRAKEVKLAKEQYSKLEEGKEIAFDIQDMRNVLDNLESAKQELNAQAASTIAENRRFNYYVYACTTHNNKRIWDSYEEFEEDENPLAFRCASELMNLVYSITQDSVKEFSAIRTENVWLKKHGFMNEDLELINKDGHLVDRENRLINEEGHYVNEAGDRVDLFGNALDENGNLKFIEKKTKSKPKAKSATEPVEA